MAKTAKVKKHAGANSKSRESKRATSPSIDVNKSLKEAPRATATASVLAARPDSGISRPKKKQKQATRAQRQRHEKGLARAAVVQDQMTKKVDDATSRLKKRRERKGMWEEVNGISKFAMMTAALAHNPLEEAPEGDGDGSDWEDEAMDELDETHVDVRNHKFAVMPANSIAGTKLIGRHQTAPAPEHVTVEDEADKIT